YARRRRARAAEPQPAAIDERAHAAAAAPAGDGRRSLGRGDQLLRDRAPRLRGEGGPRRRPPGRSLLCDRRARSRDCPGDLVGGAAHPPPPHRAGGVNVARMTPAYAGGKAARPRFRPRDEVPRGTSGLRDIPGNLPFTTIAPFSLGVGATRAPLSRGEA